jgi:hypothetical protein
VVDADAHPAGIVGDVIDAVWRRPAKLRNDEVVHPHRLGLTPRAVFAAAILEIADQLLLLGIDRDRRLARCQRFLHPIPAARHGLQPAGQPQDPRGNELGDGASSPTSIDVDTTRRVISLAAPEY